MPVDVSLEFTPNPNTLKFVVSTQLLEQGSANFSKVEETEPSPLAKMIFGIQGITGVMIGRNFITISKDEAGDWDQIYQKSNDLIQAYLNSGEKVITGDLPSAPSKHLEAGSEIEEKIKKVLDDEIRPAVAMDGGDITLDKFDAGTVYLQLQGSCSGCPSSTMTLKMGIETRLKELFPEVQEVVAV